MAVGNRTFSIVLALLVAMLLATLVLLTPAWSQQKQGLGGKRGADRSLVGAAVEVQNGENRKNLVDAGDVFKIPVKNLRAAQDATITLRDEDGTQAELVNNKNAMFSTTKQDMSVKVTDETPTEGGDGELSTDSVQIIEEDGILTIIIGDPNPDEETPDDQYADDQYAEEQYGDEQYADGDQQNDADCADAETVETFNATQGEDLVTDPFEITASRFRVSFDSDDTEFAFASVTVNDENEEFEEDFIDSFTGDGEGQDSLIVNEGPGSFFLEVSADTDAEYTVTVEDCTGDEEGNGGEETTAPLPQDEEKGPLENAIAIGDDTNGDVIGEFEGEPVVGIDIIEIAAENCEVTEADNLSVTLNDQDVPGRFIDGENADITVDEDGVTIIGTGPEDVVQPFLVEQEDAGVELPPNDEFTVESTTGIGGEGCAEVADLDTTPDTDTTDDVDTGDDLPNTGGGPADTSTALLFVVSGFALLALRIVKLRRGA